VSVTDQIEQTDLEQLISAKREQFAERIRGRTHQYEAIQPVLHKPWLAGLIMLLFVSVFGGMLYWQYPEVANSWWQRLGEVFTTPTEDSIPQAAKIVPEATSDRPPLNETAAKQVAQQNISIVNTETVSAPSEEIIPRGPEALVTDWKNVVKQIDSASISQLTQSGTDKLYQAPVVVETSLTAKTIVSQAQTNNEQVLISPVQEILKPKEDILGDDYQVEDITSVKPGETIVVAPPASTSQDAINAAESNLVISDKQGLRDFSYDENTLLKLPINQYVLQITGMRNVVLMQTYIEKYQLQNQLWVYKTQRNGIDWFVLLHNQAYATLALAKEAVGSLPQALRQGPPFPKTTKQIHQEINR
jgi:septal ring-binding cell division protein DamX